MRLGLQLLQHLKARDADAAVIMLTGAADLNTAVESLKQGASDFILKPVNLHKYLGILFDRQLLFKDQAKEAVERGKSYTHQVRRLTKVNYGLVPKMNRRIYEGVVTKKMLYAVDVWCLPSPRAVPCADGRRRR